MSLEVSDLADSVAQLRHEMVLERGRELTVRAPAGKDTSIFVGKARSVPIQPKTKFKEPPFAKF